MSEDARVSAIDHPDMDNTLYTYNFNNLRASASYPTGTRGLRCQISGCLHLTRRRPGRGPLVESVRQEDFGAHPLIKPGIAGLHSQTSGMQDSDSLAQEQAYSRV